MEAMRAHKNRLRDKGVYAGSSRLAVDFDGRKTGIACNDCGMCMHGCPKDLIYTSTHSLKKLLATGKLSYQPDVVVRSIQEEGDSVHILAADGRSFTAGRVFLAAGVLNSSEILLRSFNRYDESVEISDAQYYVFPLLQLKAAPNVAEERLNTLAQAYLEIMDDKISPYAVQIQLYGYNDLLREILKQKLGPLYPLFPENMLLGRFLLAQGYLHSDHSGKIDLTLKKNADGEDYVTHVGRVRPETRAHIDKVMRKLTQIAFETHALPVKPLLQITEPGRGYHVGGSCPMKAAPRFRDLQQGFHRQGV
jgi:ferredoxin